MYFLNRVQNAGLGLAYWGPYRSAQSAKNLALAVMRKMRASTAKRWQAHLLQGGSPKALRYKSHAMWLAVRRNYHAKIVAPYLYAQRPSCKPVQEWVVSI